MLSKALLLSLLPLLASADLVKISVGPATSYSPESTTAKVGDTIEFVFEGGSHDVVQGTLASPCSPKSGSAFYSGFISPGSGDVFRVTVENEDPIYFYCSVPGHCQAGMVGVINGPDKLDALKQAAAAATGSTAPSTVGGGVIVKQDSPVSSAAVSETATSSEAPASSTSGASSAGASTTGAATTTSARSSTSATGSAAAATSTAAAVHNAVAAGGLWAVLGAVAGLAVL